jgi:VanZ family protein
MLWRYLCLLQFYVLLVIYTYLGLTPHPENAIPVFNDLLMHFAGYSVAAISISFARPTWPFWQRATLLIIYSIAIEIAQHFNPPRTFSGMDILANTSGVLLGLFTVFLLEKYISPFSKLLYWQTNIQHQADK